MQTIPVTISREEARELYQAYLKHRHYSTPIDAEVMSAYQKLAAGKTVIQAIASVAKGGVDELGLPKLALARADAKFCQLSMYGNGSATMTTAKRARSASRDRMSHQTFSWPVGTFPNASHWKNAESIVPPVPLHLRPNRGMENYYILYEAEWRKAVPVDPFLLRRIGKSDLWLVLAHWDLTPVEAAALSARL
jgi:hypothetical protein